MKLYLSVVFLICALCHKVNTYYGNSLQYGPISSFYYKQKCCYPNWYYFYNCIPRDQHCRIVLENFLCCYSYVTYKMRCNRFKFSDTTSAITSTMTLTTIISSTIPRTTISSKTPSTTVSSTTPTSTTFDIFHESTTSRATSRATPNTETFNTTASTTTKFTTTSSALHTTHSAPIQTTTVIDEIDDSNEISSGSGSGEWPIEAEYPTTSTYSSTVTDDFFGVVSTLKTENLSSISTTMKIDEEILVSGSGSGSGLGSDEDSFETTISKQQKSTTDPEPSGMRPTLLRRRRNADDFTFIN